VKRSQRSKTPQPVETRTAVSLLTKVPESAELRRQAQPADEGRGARQIEMVSLNSLKPAKRNARTHSKKQVEQIANSIRRFGVINPIIVDSQNQIVAGHARADACRLLDKKAVLSSHTSARRS
jgi:ribosomal protein S25